MHHYLGYFTPSHGQLAGLGAVLLVSVALVAIGALAGGRKRIYETDLIVGWALVSLAFVLAGGLLRVDFVAVSVGILAVAIAAAIYIGARDRGRWPSDVLRAVALALPAIWLAACMALSQWDEFTQWMPNARYIYTHDGFPGDGMPPTVSVFPAYPHGLAFIIYLGSRIAGHLVENASGIFSVILLAMFGVTVGRVVRKAMTRRDPNRAVPLGLNAVQPAHLGWVYCAIGGIAVTILNPTFVPKIVFTAYADTATAVLVGMLVVLIWTLLNTLSGEESEFSANHLAWRFGFVAMALIAVKQVNLVILLIILVAAATVVARDSAIPARAFLKALPALALMPLAMYLLWRFHLQHNGVSGEFAFAAPADWLIDDLGVIVQRMLLIASKKGGYFGVMLIATAFAVRALWRLETPFDRLSLIVGLVFVGYTFFLLFAYVTAFTQGEAVRAASYWRYNMHLGGASVAFGAFGIALLWRRWITNRMRRNLGWIAILLALAGPFASAGKIRFDLRPAKLYVRATAEEIASLLPQDARTVLLDLGGNGDFGVIARYSISRTAGFAGEMTAASQPTEENIRRYIAATDPSHIWIHFVTPEARRALGLPLAAGASHLVRKTTDGWSVVKSWPYPGYENPYVLAD